MNRVIALGLAALLALSGCSEQGGGEGKKDEEKKKSDLPGEEVDAMSYRNTPSGLVYYVLRTAEGAKPTAADTVRVHYTGWQLDGKKFDSSVDRGEPAEFPLGGVIKGWTEGLQLMPVGSKYKFVIPAKLAYGENPGGGRPGGTLVFDVELLAIVPK